MHHADSVCGKMTARANCGTGQVGRSRQLPLRGISFGWLSPRTYRYYLF